MAERVQSRAIVQRNDAFVEETIQLPTLGSHELLIRVRYAALNPTDKLALEVNAFGDGAILGCDFAGIVQDVGTSVTRFAVGDKVAAFIWGGEREGLGAFSEFCIADEKIAFKVPENITLEQAATIPLAATTAFLALFSPECLSIQRDNPHTEPVLILGGSSSVGSFANQIAALHRIRTISTTSKKNEEATIRDGAVSVFDYADADCLSKIRKSYPTLNLVLDSIGNVHSSSMASEVIGKRPGIVCTVRPGKTGTEYFPSNIHVCDVFVFTAFLKPHTYRGKFHWEINHVNHNLSSEFHSRLSDLIADGQIRPRPVKSLGALSAEAVMEGMRLLQGRRVSNEKICFTVYND